jgi:branched-chain amino acid transport system substrate-binding protein
VRTANRPNPSTLLAVALLGVATLLASSCNLIVDASTDSCTTDADCVNLPSTRCDTGQGVCVSVDLCSANADCPDDQICRHFSPRACVSLKTGAPTKPADSTSDQPNCNTIYPDDPAIWRDDDTILIGVTSPRSYFDGTTLFDSVDTITNGAILAVDEINDKGGVDNQSKLALVICDDYGNDNFAENNGRALAAMGIQSLIGAAYSSQTIDMATGTDGRPGTVANGVLAISTGATSPDVTGIEDHAPACVQACAGDAECESACPGLLWRTAPSDKIQGDALNTYFQDLEPIVKDRSGTTQLSIKVTVLHADDSYGRNLSDFVKTGLEFNGKKANQQPTLFHIRSYGAGETPDAAVLQLAIDDAADVYILLPTYNELAGSFIPDLEAAWTGADETRPYYVLTDGALNEDMITDLVGAGAQGRARGTIPGTDNARFTDFRYAYETRFPDAATQGTPDTFGAAGAYDAVYLMTYSALAAKSKPLIGEELARGLAMTADVANGAIIEAGPTAFGDASSDLRNGVAINFEGASGPLDFNLQTGEAPSDIQVWCVDAAGATPYSGRYFDPASGTTKGAADPGTGACPF